MQNDNRETEIEIDEKVYATEEQYLEQSKRIKEMKKPKILSNWDKEEIFFVRWFTFGISTIIVVAFWVLFLNLNGYVATCIMFFNWLFPPFIFFRKGIKELLKEKIIYWWSMLNGRIP